jgi:AcrR family transcriptional regulator
MSTKEKILDASLQVFLSKGFERASMNDIVESSNFTKGAIYHHFKNKDEIFQGAMVRLFDEMENWFESVFKDLQSIKQILRSHFSAIGDMRKFLNSISKTEDVAEFNYYTLMLDAIMKLPDFRKEYKEKHTAYLHSFTELIRKEQANGSIRKELNPGVLAFMIHALLEGSFLYSIMDENIELSKLGPQMFELLWKVVTEEKKQ